jgi:hypothetical protein
MQDTELFLSMAEIAGVFIGFGALIAIRSGGPPNAVDVVGVGMVVFVATIVVVMSLAPIAISRFGVTGHDLWQVCSVIALLLWWAGDEVIVRTSPERRRFMAAAPLKVRWRGELTGAAAWIPANVALVLAVLGLPPDREAALYFAAAALFLLFDAMLLLMMVFRVGFPVSIEGRSAEVAEAPPTPVWDPHDPARDLPGPSGSPRTGGR